MEERQLRAKHFRDAEASFLLEGLDVSDDAFYQATKARVLAGEIDSEEAIRLAVEYSKACVASATVEVTASSN